MAEIIPLERPDEPEEYPSELQCLNCSSTSFLIFPDSMITCCNCAVGMELAIYGTLYLKEAPSNGE